jgi:hypothetical protein
VTTPVVAVGLGPIGQRIVARLVERGDVEVVGAADIDPALAGSKLADVIAGYSGACEIVADIDELPAGPGVAVLSTATRIARIAPQVEQLVAKGWNVVSTSEELVFPSVVDSAWSERIDAMAKQHGVTVLGTGINPGFLMDSLVLSLRHACARVDAVRVERRVDTNQRREPLQKKVGVGMTKDEFEALAATNGIGHVGLIQSAHLLAHGLGWTITDYHETIEPVVTDLAMATGLGQVEPGMVIGQHQHSRAMMGGRAVIEYDLWMYAGCTNTDVISIEGEPSIRQVIEGGVNGDIGTEAVVTNMVAQLPDAPAGLVTMAQLASLNCGHPGA